MIRSLFSGVSAVKNEQVRMDTIGNNIANVNTIGYKAGRTGFMDALSQSLRGSGVGRNPMQVGTGVGMAGIATNMNQGALQMTGRSMDLAINGNGFFEVAKGVTASGDTAPDISGGLDANGNGLYTRDGTFFADANGYVCNANGYYLLDTSGAAIQLADPTTTPIETVNIDQNGNISVNGADIAKQIALRTFPNPEGLEKKSSNLYAEANASGAPSDRASVTPGSTGVGTIESGYLEMANADLSEEFTNMITTQRGYQAGARIITVSDTLLEELINLKR
ncbi:MAG: hypothetical protein VR69_11625 [Peptococcaceae bacterium BRH_c4b]|nr:MAG: hypothetical protein VR69_11625 [Peptococcaceae bacterium BRH_c4b]